ncbi:hypothetical protein [Mesobacillus sp. S13]|uniref:hypothetical protein n=1 Tax=Mesobacillus sp. S13 TaxID=2880221 RepID=UPI001CF5231D|nr:hypothetical protein [Mesobacillus sp. S13]
MLDQDLSTVLSLVKDRLGIRSTVRDTYITAIIKGIAKELEVVKGLTLDVANEDHHLMFVVDLATWRYQNRDSMEGTPRHLQFRLNELYVQAVQAGSVTP